MAVNTTRRNTAIAAAVCYFITIPFLILVLIGNTRMNNSVLTDIFFFKLDVSQIIPIAVANSNLLNSVARSLGLHDFYQVGLWNFCEGYNDEGVTFCSNPVRFYWFNPVEILVSELLAGARIALPSAVITVLKLLRIGSQTMYVCFMAGTVINFVLVFATCLVIRTRWFSLLIGFFAGASSVLLTVAAIIATVISVAAKVALTSQDQLNIRADIGIKMFAFMWIGALVTDLAFLLHAAMGCCCKPNRGPRQGQSPPAAATSEKKGLALPDFVRRRRGAET
ncbi:SUR7/PalI family protein [Hirsutella rhossiliensis]|uniref:SUR7/PalI family domain-containing protein n=1 Tax=Hirsutella rhossiliensis TaxID=111463 RepID=A0A9P8MVC7_9HYPO|nr:SUR7/PalI family domain-containing protein [Hirsutella rhossiliensis]KAH0961920.1 SUR7/PalI family domain-containing protein [Hirsutella rhossiliensis]